MIFERNRKFQFERNPPVIFPEVARGGVHRVFDAADPQREIEYPTIRCSPSHELAPESIGSQGAA